MNKTNTAYITIGKVGSTYGVHGWLKIHSFTEFGASILDYSPWYLEGNNTWDAIRIEAKQARQKTILVKFIGIETPETARLLTGKKIAIPRSQLPQLKQGEYYWSDLEGLTVINKNGQILGTVSYLIETGSNDVLVVKSDKEHAIPYLMGSVILSVDLEKQEILVDWEVI